MSVRAVADAEELGEGAACIGGIVAGTHPGGSVDDEEVIDLTNNDSFVAEDMRLSPREEVCNRRLAGSRRTSEQIALPVTG